MDEPIVITNTIAPIELATEDLTKDMKCIVNSLQKYLNYDLTPIYWNNVNISKQANDKVEWYLEDTICHTQKIIRRNVSLYNIIIIE